MKLFRVTIIITPIVAALTMVGPAAARGDTTVAIRGIGTRVGEIQSHVTSVTYAGPEFVEVEGFGEAVEIRGTVSGVGWGGIGIVPRASSAPYVYTIPFVARWRASGSTRDLLVHQHGGDVPLLVAAIRDRLDGPRNPSRRAEFSSDASAGLPALWNRCAYAATNRRGILGDGTFGATYLPSAVPPLSQDEVDALHAQIAPGDPTYRHPELVAGAPVPLSPTNDVPTFRDISRTLERVLEGVIGRSFRTRIFSGLSNGAALGAGINFGRSAIGSRSVPTGGNQVVPYDPGSRPIFDGFLFTGFLYNSDVARADDAFPISAPAFFIQGRGDERYQHPIRMAHELLQKGVSLDRWIRIYEVKGLTHVTRDAALGLDGPAAGDAIGPFVSAALRNMVELLREGVEPPVSRIAGRLQDGALVFDQAGGSTTAVQPVLEDPAIDTVKVDAMLTPRPIGLAETLRWLQVTATLPHEPDAITPPTIACRLGGYRIGFFGAELAFPFPPATLDAAYGGFAGYRACLDQVVDDLEARRLYDPRIESARETARRSSSLFAP